MEEAANELDTALNGTALDPYIEEISYSHGDKIDGVYYIDINIKVSEHFQDMSRREEYITLGQTAESVVDEVVSPSCGSADCEFGEMKVTSGDDVYTLSGLQFSVGYFFDSLMVRLNDNSQKRYREAISTEYTESNSSTKTSSSPSSSSSPSDEEVYEYMKSQYDQITNYGANYVPEIHDDQVAELASQKFGISASEAGQIYIDMEMSQY